ncbi:hypothetical protein [Bradyrhizobium sp.]|uniref:hypothetical protein n=1 Tax=Bradyrhizobium sp. TaxID=376 RepID=UPI003C5BBB42
MRPILSRRSALAGLAATGVAGRIGVTRARDTAGPIFSNRGPRADFYGAAEGYPVPDAARARRQGNPWQPKDRVGAFTHLDEIYPIRQVKASATPWMFWRAAAELPDSLRDRVTVYLSRNPVTGLLIAKDDRILFEG